MHGNPDFPSKRVAYIADAVIPSRFAHAVHIMKMCEGWANAGHIVHLLVPETTDDPEYIAADPYSYFGVQANFQLIRIPTPKYKRSSRLWFWNAAICAAKLNSDLVHTRAEIAGLFAAELDMQVIYEKHRNLFLANAAILHPGNNLGRNLRRHFSAFKRYWRIKLRLARKTLLKQSNKKGLSPDIVFSYRQLLKIRGFATEDQLFRRLLRHRNLISYISITQALQQDLVKAMPTLADKIAIIPDGAEKPGDKPTMVQLAPRTRVNLGYCGHLYEGKGMEIIAELVKHCPEAHFHIVGGLPTDLEKWQRHLSRYDNITFYGHVAPYLTDAYIAQFDICLLPNQRRVFLANKENDIDIGKYTSPMKLFQYMAAGKPIIASAIPVLGEILEDNHNALLCAPEDITAWQQAIRTLIDNPELGQRLGNQAQDDLVSRYTWSARASRILAQVNSRQH